MYNGDFFTLLNKIFFFIEQIFFLLSERYRTNIFYIEHINFTVFKFHFRKIATVVKIV
jgi:hypothetical protein